MKEYGYINEGGYLRSREIEEYNEQYLDGNEIKTRIITEQEQLAKLAAIGWKPVDAIDNSRMIADEGYIVRLIPYDAGDRISFKYEQVRDIQLNRVKIEQLKNSLNESDYKIIKCYEASLVGEELPYDIIALRAEREEARNRINSLEAEIAALK